MTALTGFAGKTESGGEGPRHPVVGRIARIFGGALLLLAGGVVFATVVSDPAGGIRAMFSLLPISVFAMTAIAGRFLMNHEETPFAPVGALAVIVSIISGAIAVAWVWTAPIGDRDSTVGPGLGNAAEVGVVCSLALAHVSLLLAARRENDGRVITALISAAVGLTIGLATMITLAIAQGFLGADESFWQMIGATAILTLVVTGLVAISHQGRRHG